MPTSSPFERFAYAALSSTAIPHLLTMRAATVLERIAYGGGNTEWYRCTSPGDLRPIASMLKPGSCVSFYFGDQLRVSPDATVARVALRAILQTEPDAVLGILPGEGVLTVKVSNVSIEDLDEELESVANASMLLFGPFPPRQNDGISAVTLDLPDADGIVRAHPH